MANDKNPFNIDEDKPSDWFDPLYSNSDASGEGVPWANMDTHPAFSKWLSLYPLAGEPLKGKQQSALVVGCGMGDDAIKLESLGFDVTAFDVSETAIKLCKERFPESKVNFVAADLLNPPVEWQQKFDFVLEIYTVQALPPKYEPELIANIASFVADSGQLLVIAEVSDQERQSENGPPWLLNPNHVDHFIKTGLVLENQIKEEGALDLSSSETFITALKRQ